MNVCEHITVLVYGQPIAHGTPEEIQGNQKVIDAYLGSDEEDAA
jgi:ABC-type branched-subunit amino acid transport system ATPase component